MPQHVLTPARERVLACHVGADGVRLDTTTGSVVVDAEPDERSAVRLHRLATRIVSVEITDDPQDGSAASVTAVWHRVPHTRAVPLGAALALALAGAPTFVQAVGR